jgi:hypothetical protein
MIQTDLNGKQGNAQDGYLVQTSQNWEDKAVVGSFKVCPWGARPTD